MTMESRLAITIDSRSAKRNVDDLAGALARVEKVGDAVASSAEHVSSTWDDQRKELYQLLGQINPTVAALGRLDDMQEKLAKFKKTGIVESDTFIEYNDRINILRQTLGDTAEGMNKAGMSAKAYNAAMRGLPAQFTDIAVSLQAGQAPLTVFLQQGGQLKDMFGGVGPAARAMGGYVAGLVNPFTVAAAAASALALAYYQGSEESERFANTLIENGNAAGLTANQLSDMANQVAASSGTVGAAAEVLNQLAAAGNPLRGMYVEIAQASLAWSKQTGRDVSEVVKSFNDIAKDPVASIKKLDGELNILTASQYANIVSLQEQGKTMEAARTAADIYSGTISSRAGQMEENLGTLETAWRSLGEIAKGAWDKMLNIGREDTTEQKLAAAYERYRDLTRNGRDAASEDPFRFNEVTSEITKLQQTIADESWAAWEQAGIKSIQDAGKKGIDLINSTYRSSLTQTQKLQKELTNLDKARVDAIAAGGFTAAEEEKYAKSRKNIEQEIADIKTREAKRNAPKNVNRGLAEAANTFARLYGQYDPAAQAARALTKEQGQLDLVLSKGKITQEEYSKALAQASVNYAAALKGAQGLTAVEQYRAQLQRQLVNEQAQYQLDAAGIGMGGLQSSRMQQRLSLEMQTNDRLLQLQTELANATDQKQRQALQGQIDAINEFLPQQLAAMQAGWAQIDQAMLNPIAGWTAAVQNFGNQARDIAGQTQSVFSSAFNTISTDITSAIMSGSLSFNTLGDISANVTREIIGGFVKMGVQMGVNAALNATLGTAAAGQSMILAGTTATAWAPAAAMASLATLGANSVPAATALTSTTALATSLAVIPGFATGGFVSGAGTGTSDSIMARLSDGEFVVNAAATKRNRGLLEAINSNERVSMVSAGGAVPGPREPSAKNQAVQVTHQVYIVNNSNAVVETRTGEDGRLEVLIQAVEDRLAEQVATGWGTFTQALEQSYVMRRNAG